MSFVRKIGGVMVALGLAFGGLVFAAPSASAASCGSVAIYSDNGIVMKVVQSCSSLAKVKYTADCVWPAAPVTKTVTFPRGGASMITTMPACWSGTRGTVKAQLLNP